MPGDRDDGVLGPYLTAHLDGDGQWWVTGDELARCQEAMEESVDPAVLAAAGAPADQFTLAEAARLAGVTRQYLRGRAAYYEKHREKIDAAEANGRNPRRAYLKAHRGTRNRWNVTRAELAAYLSRRRPPAVRVAYDAIQAGNDHALAWLEDHAALARVKGDTVPAVGWTVASFRHLTSRALDPFAHHHNVIANTVQLPDGTRRALDARGLYQHAHAASALATAEMRHQLNKTLGVAWRPSRHGGWEIDGITDDVLREFSTRRSEIDDALAELEDAIGRGAHPGEVEHIVLQTRPAKQHTPAATLIDHWRQRAETHGLDLDALSGCGDRDTPIVEPDPDTLFASIAGPDGICENLSIFDRGDAITHLADHPIPPPDDPDGPGQPLLVGAHRLEALTDAFLASPHVIDLEHGRYTTVEMLGVQNRIVERFRAGLHRGAHLANPAQVDAALAGHPHLTAEQQALARSWVTSGHRFQAAIGRPGTGKTTTVAACAQAWKAAGWRVLGAAVKGEAARTLAAATGLECETVAWHLTRDRIGSPALNDRTVLVVDEASTLADRDLDTLMDIAARTGASIRLVGDPAQHSAVGAGGMFRVLCEQHTQVTPELTHTHRLQDPHDRAAADAMRAGRIDDAFDRLAAAGHLHIATDELAMYRHVLARWWDAHQAGLDHPMVDRRNSTRRTLNRLAHHLLHAHGHIAPDELAASDKRGFSVGDRVTARLPNRDLHVDGNRRAYIRNGALGTITHTRRHRRRPERDTLTVDFDGIGTITVPRDFFDRHQLSDGRSEVGIDHAYALTSYAVQGSTREVSTSRIDATANRKEAYVDITRGRQANHLYLTAAPEPLDGEALPKPPPDPTEHAIADRLQHANGERTAWEIAHPCEPASEAIGL